MTSPDIDPNNPFTRDLLRSITAGVRAQPDETEAEYAERFAAATAAWAALGPRDPTEQMVAAQIVSAQYAGLDCLDRAMAAEDPRIADKLRRCFAQLSRAMVNAMRLLDKLQQRPATALAPPPPVIAPVPALRRRPPAEKMPQHPVHREKALPAPPPKDPAKMSDEELNASLDEMRALYDEAMSDEQHPLHREAMNLRPEDFPGGVIPGPRKLQ